MAKTKELYIIGGPNGAGKTTGAFTLAPQFLALNEFVNADEIARGLSPFNPEGVALQAGKIMLERIHKLTEEGKSFAIETTCSGVRYKSIIKNCKAAGYTVIETVA